MKELFEQLAAQVGEVVKLALKTSYRLQGHYLTGALSKSIDYNVNATVNGATIEFLMLDYGVIQDRGVSAANIPYSGRTGRGGRSAYIEGLKTFARLRFGVDEKEAERIAFAIATKHKREGMPTAASYRYSQTGKRTGAIDAALDESDAEIQRLINVAMEEYINVIFIKAMKQ